MLCPLKNRSQYYSCNCEEENCAWYNNNKEECCIRTLAKLTENMEEVVEGQGTIFVREV